MNILNQKDPILTFTSQRPPQRTLAIKLVHKSIAHCVTLMGPLKPTSVHLRLPSVRLGRQEGSSLLLARESVEEEEVV